MDREQIEIRYLELLNRGDDPFADEDIAAAIARDAALRDELDSLGALLGALPDAVPAPEFTVPRERIDALAAAFSEGLRQGQRPARHRLQGGIAVAATLIAFFGGVLWQRSESTTAVASLDARVHDLQQTVAVSMLQDRSPAARIRGLEYAHAIDTPGEQLISAMSTTLRSDESITVRLATADALDRVGTLPQVRRAIAEALLHERDPLVQLRLIDMLMNVRDVELAQSLHELMENPNTDELVRQRLRWALEEKN